MEGQRPVFLFCRDGLFLLQKHFYPKIPKNIFPFVSRCIFHFSILYKNKVVLLAEIRAKILIFPLTTYISARYNYIGKCGNQFSGAF